MEKRKGKSKKQLERRRERRMQRMSFRDIPISSGLKTSPKVLKILVLGGYHSTKPIMPLLNKLTRMTFSVAT